MGDLRVPVLSVAVVVVGCGFYIVAIDETRPRKNRY